MKYLKVLFFHELLSFCVLKFRAKFIKMVPKSHLRINTLKSKNFEAPPKTPLGGGGGAYSPWTPQLMVLGSLVILPTLVAIFKKACLKKILISTPVYNHDEVGVGWGWGHFLVTYLLNGTLQKWWAAVWKSLIRAPFSIPNWYLKEQEYFSKIDVLCIDSRGGLRNNPVMA